MGLIKDLIDKVFGKKDSTPPPPPTPPKPPIPPK